MKKNVVFLLSVGIGVCFVPVHASVKGCMPGMKQASLPGQVTATTPWNQAIAVTGTVSDGTGALPGVTVRVKGKSTTTLTDTQGKYAITVEEGEVLVFSYIGFREYEATVTKNSNIINVVLEEDAETLKEVTVNAGYYKVKDKERTGSIAKITSKDIETQPVTNVLAAMQGRMAGVSITQTTGVSGGGFDIQIRGQNSLRAEGNSPLYIIDGVPYATEEIGYSQTSGALPRSTSPLNSINPSDIESLEVLKDADATAIYGSRGANGVVLISTKKGKSGKTSFTANISKGIGRVTRFMDLMNTQQYLEMRNEALANDGVAPSFMDYDVNGIWEANRYTDWQKVLLGGTADFTNAQLSLSGGSAQTQFLVGGNYHKETTVFPGKFDYQKGNIRASINHRSADGRFGIVFAAGYTAQKNNQPGTDLTRDATVLAPNAPALYDDEGVLNWEGSTWTNPLAALVGKNLSNTHDLLANTVLSYKILDGLEAKTAFGFTDTRHEESVTSPNTLYDPAYMVGTEYSYIFKTGTDKSSWIIEPQITYRKTMGRGRLDAVIGSTFQHQQGRQQVVQATGFTSNALIDNLSAASEINIVADSETIYRYTALFGRLNYNWEEKYIVNLTGRRDGSSRFGPGKRFANFGAVGTAWLFSNEAFLKDNSILSFGKLRASYGSSGNDQIGDYQFLETYALTGRNYGVPGLQPTRLYNPDFAWESSRKVEAAIELGFLNDRIFFTAAFYDNRAANQLVGIPLPGTTGFPSIQANLDATVQNRGMELTLHGDIIKGPAFSWSADVNFSKQRNKLLAFPNLEGSTYKNQLIIGEALNIRKVYHSLGVDPATGMYAFADMDGDGAITPSDRKAVVDFNPEFFGGFQNQFKYKGFQLDVLFQFVKQQNYAAIYRTGLPGTMGNHIVGALDRWQEAGDVAPHQMYTTGLNGDATTAFARFAESDGIVTDASYVRLKNISLSYTLPERWNLGGVCRLYVEAQNLLTFTKYDGPDPEFKLNGYLPPLKVVTAGINVTF